MSLSIFDDKSHRPAPAELTAVLGKSAALWEALVAHTAEAHPPLKQEWNFAGAKYGWSMRLKRRDRVVLYMTPQAGHFLVGVALGEKAAAAAHSARLTENVLALIDNAPRYAEGRGIRFPVTRRSDVAAAEMLAALKMGKGAERC